jgi:hypothetical protein
VTPGQTGACLMLVSGSVLLTTGLLAVVLLAVLAWRTLFRGDGRP